MSFGNVTIESDICCGLGEINGIMHAKDPEANAIQILFVAFCYWHFNRNKEELVRLVIPAQGVLVFTQARYSKENYGEKLAAYIKKNKLGKVVKSAEGNNQNHKGSKITAYLWTLDRKAIRAWAKRPEILEHAKKLAKEG